jgi:hypothetical protein
MRAGGHKISLDFIGMCCAYRGPASTDALASAPIQVSAGALQAHESRAFRALFTYMNDGRCSEHWPKYGTVCDLPQE